MLTEVKHQIEDGFVLIILICFRTADLYQVDYIVVLEELQDTDLAQCCDGKLEVGPMHY